MGRPPEYSPLLLKSSKKWECLSVDSSLQLQASRPTPGTQVTVLTQRADLWLRGHLLSWNCNCMMGLATRWLALVHAPPLPLSSEIWEQLSVWAGIFTCWHENRWLV